MKQSIFLFLLVVGFPSAHAQCMDISYEQLKDMKKKDLLFEHCFNQEIGLVYTKKSQAIQATAETNAGVMQCHKQLIASSGLLVNKHGMKTISCKGVLPPKKIEGK